MDSIFTKAASEEQATSPLDPMLVEENNTREYFPNCRSTNSPKMATNAAVETRRRRWVKAIGEITTAGTSPQRRLAVDLQHRNEEPGSRGLAGGEGNRDAILFARNSGKRKAL